MLRVILTTACLCFAQSTLAEQEGLYYGAGIGLIDTNLDTNFTNSNAPEDEVSFTNLELSVGYKLRSYIGGEFRVGHGVSNGEYAFSETQRAETTIDHYESLYYRLEAANYVAKSYILIGISNLATTTDITGQGSSSDSDTGLSYGAGIGFSSSEGRWNLNFEWRKILDTDDFDFSVLGMTIDRRFGTL